MKGACGQLGGENGQHEALQGGGRVVAVNYSPTPQPIAPIGRAMVMLALATAPK